jgi:hypothetical protein
MKVAALILALLVASTSAGILDAPSAFILATSDVQTFTSAVTVEINAAFTLLLNTANSVVSILVQVGQSAVTLITSFGVAGAELLVEATADAADLVLYVTTTFNPTAVTNAIVSQFNVVLSAAIAQINADVAAVSALVLSGKVKYACLQKVQGYVKGNISEFTAEIRAARDQYNQMVQNQTATLNAQIQADFAAMEKNITDTCGGHLGSKEVGCDVAQYEVLRPDIKKKAHGYVDQAKAAADQDAKAAQANAQNFQADFQARYNKIKADIAKCSAA